ncbi:MAG: hydroxyacylglutathione hydrolase C-terminal domain-containing protein, partial [Ascidiaceihabitans sp.]
TFDPANSSLILRIKDIEDKRANGLPTIPSTLELERETNPFLRADNPEIQEHLNLTGASPIDVFTEIRARKDRF